MAGEYRHERDLLNQRQVSGSNAAQTITLTGLPGKRIFLQSVELVCSAGTSVLTVESPSGTVIWETIAALALARDWPPHGIVAAPNVDVLVKATAAGVGNTTTMSVQGERA